MSPRLVNRPWDVISTDFIGPLPMSHNRNHFILVVLLKMFPLKLATSTAVVKHLENDVFLIYGAPERIMCDNGCQYVSKAVKDMIRFDDCQLARMLTLLNV